MATRKLKKDEILLQTLATIDPTGTNKKYFVQLTTGLGQWL